MPHHIRVFKRKIGRMVTAKATPSNGYAACAGFVHGPWGKLFGQHPVVSDMGTRPIGRVNAFVVPALLVDTIDTVYFNQAVINKPAYAVDQTKIFILIIAPH